MTKRKGKLEIWRKTKKLLAGNVKQQKNNQKVNRGTEHREQQHELAEKRKTEDTKSKFTDTTLTHTFEL